MAKGKTVGGVAVDQLKSIIGRVEKLEEEKQIHFEKACTNRIRTIIKMRKMDASEREEAETILDTYLNALGMLPEMEDAA